jgi:hypothetical protein
MDNRKGKLTASKLSNETMDAPSIILLQEDDDPMVFHAASALDIPDPWMHDQPSVFISQVAHAFLILR